MSTRLHDSPLAYDDIRPIMDHALAAPNGIAINLPTEGKALNFRHRINRFRAMERRESKQVYPFGDPLHGRTPYDKLFVDIAGTKVIIRLREKVVLDIEEL